MLNFAMPDFQAALMNRASERANILLAASNRDNCPPGPSESERSGIIRGLKNIGVIEAPSHRFDLCTRFSFTFTPLIALRKL